MNSSRRSAITQQHRENTVLLALLKAGVPSAPVLAAKGLDDLLAIAAKHKVKVEVPTVVLGGGGSSSHGGRSSPTTVSSESDHEQMQPPQSPFYPPPVAQPNGAANALMSRARMWRHHHTLQQQQQALQQQQRQRQQQQQQQQQWARPRGSSGAAAATTTTTVSAKPTGEAVELEIEPTPGIYLGERNETGERHGRGAYHFADGGVYEGDWRNNLQEGIGAMRYTSGSVYEGQWARGLQHGRGVFRFASGSLYDGEWSEGRRHGKATCRYADGRAEVATFKNGENARGEGAMWSADRQTAWRIVRDGEYVEEISLQEAANVAARVGEPVPSRLAAYHHSVSMA